MTSRFVGRLLAALVLATLGAASLFAIPVSPVTQTFVFQGICDDCIGDLAPGDPLIGEAILVLQGYTPGDPIGPGNLVSFDYLGTDWFPAFTILAGSNFYINGIIPPVLPSSSVDFYIEQYFIIPDGIQIADGVYFRTTSGYIGDSGVIAADSGGPYWDTGWIYQAPFDMGQFYVWNPGAIPEPASYLLAAAGLALIALRRRRG